MRLISSKDFRVNQVTAYICDKCRGGFMVIKQDREKESFFLKCSKCDYVEAVRVMNKRQKRLMH